VETTTAAVQRRTLRVLSAAQVLGGVAVGSAISVSGLIAEDVSGSTALSGLAQTSNVLGAAVAALPMSRLMSARGRRPGLVGGYLVALAGAGLMIVGTAQTSFGLVVLGALLQGVATTANLQSRFAAADLAEPMHRGRALATVVWATTIGVVLGPNLTGPGASVARTVDLPDLAGPVLFSVVAFAMAAAVVHLGLRPDPLLTARRIAGTHDDDHSVPLSQSVRAVRSAPPALLAMIAIAVAHTVMVSVMVMTPVHMRHEGAELELVGLVISLHVTGMFAFSPVVGWLVDRAGRVPVIVLGNVVLLCAVLVSGTTDDHGVLGGGLLLLGLGWSCVLISGSTLLSESVDVGVRPGVQGLSDFVMGMCGAAGGALAGVVVDLSGYGLLNALSGVLVLPVLVLVMATRRPADVRP
jgi:MFS family permease